MPARVRALPSALTLLTLLAACSSGKEGGDGVGSTSDPTCEQGDTRECLGPGRCEGAQRCVSQKEGWGECDCGRTPDAGAGSARELTADDEVAPSEQPDLTTAPGAPMTPANGSAGGSAEGGTSGAVPAAEPASSSSMGGGPLGGSAGTGGSSGGSRAGGTTGVGGSSDLDCDPQPTDTTQEIAARLQTVLTGPDVDVAARAAEAGWDLRLSAERAAAFDFLWSEPETLEFVIETTLDWFDLSGPLVGVDVDVADSFLTEAKLVVTDLIERDAPLGEFFLLDQSFVDARLAGVYGMDEPASDWEQQALPTERRGILMLGAFLTGRISPPRRGKSIYEFRNCGTFPTHAPDVLLELPEAQEGMTTRERYQSAVSEPACLACHHVVDGIGFGLLNFDEAGVFRDMEQGQPIDASGEFDSAATFGGPLEMTRSLSMDLLVAHCMATSAARRAAPELGSGASCALADLGKDVDANDSIRQILRSVVVSEVFAIAPAE